MKSNKINIILMLPSLRAGGAERVMSFVAQELNPNKFNATLVIIGYKKDTFYNIDGVETVYFEKSRVMTAVRSIYNYLRINKPDIVISAIEHLNTVVAYISLFFPKIKFVAREVNVLSVLQSIEKTTKFSPFDRLYNNRFKYFDAVICQSQDMLEDLTKHYKIDQNKLIIINNPISDDFTVKTSKSLNQPLQLITVGRLAKQKGYDRILKALSQLKISFHYTIIGNGPEKERIYSLIEQFDLKKNVNHIESTQNVSDYLAQSDIYLQGSYVEGFPNALIESCAVGTPVIAYNAPGGINEIIIEGVNGQIVMNEKEFIEQIHSIYTKNDFEPNKVSESVYSKFNKNLIIKQYEDLFLRIQKTKNNKK